ncbi:DNA polymerase-like protein [Tanacetum coccineum]
MTLEIDHPFPPDIIREILLKATLTGRELWNPPKNSAVQLAAAITASARIYMYPYISRDDCYYTDTDSVVLSQPLPEELISSSILGMLKLEDQIVKGHSE